MEGDLRGGVPGVEERVSGEMGVSVMHADRVNLFFVTFDTVGRANVVSEQPGLSALGGSRHLVGNAASEQRRADECKIPVDCVCLDQRLAIVV